jgi:hypothetical protein
LGKTQADDEPLGLDRILEVCGLDDALWSLRCWPQHSKHWRLYAVWCARQVQHLMADPRGAAALDVAERHARGEATDEELNAASAAARDAAWAAANAAWAAANTNVASAAEYAAFAATAAAFAAKGEARRAALNAQAEKLREICRQCEEDHRTLDNRRGFEYVLN